MFKKVKTEHHSLKEFHKFFLAIEKDPRIIRIIPGVIHRKQKKSSKELLHFSYFTQSGIKYNISKGSTAQELFIVCKEEDREGVDLFIRETYKIMNE